ncbi:MAG: AbrB/MazE/SpoVT family DNA-binding domain-containing protein [Desulfobacteraceae bacterium]|nr:AbrB/MazE/SpoVT family DNA-binding domain-containing protein [Desulfobacteraceae bacterium]
MHAIKLRKIGNSVGLVLPREILAKLKVREGETIYLTDTKDGFRITPYNEEFEVQMDAAEKIMNEDRDILRELSKK